MSDIYKINKVLILLEAAAHNEIHLLQIIFCHICLYFIRSNIGLIESESETMHAKLIFHTLSRYAQLKQLW